MSTQILQATERGRFKALGPEERAFTAEVQRPVRRLFGTFEGLDLVESQPHLLIHRFKGRYSTASPQVRVVLAHDGKLSGLWIKPWQEQMQ